MFPPLFPLSISSLFAVVLGVSATFTCDGEEADRFTTDDYFKLNRIAELALSSDGEMVAYATERQSLEENKTVRSVFVSATKPGFRPILLDELQNAKNFTWVPDTNELAYLLNVNGVTNLYAINPKTKRIQPLTENDNPVMQFRYALDGASLAWLSYAQPKGNLPSFHDRLFSGEQGIIFDSEYSSVYHFVDPEQQLAPAQRTPTLWIKVDGDDAFAAPIPGKVKTFHWSTDGSKLSITYSAGYLATQPFAEKFTSVGVLDVATKTFTIVARGRAPSKTESAVYYAGGEWVPGVDKLIIRRIAVRDAWMSQRKWALLDLSAGEPWEVTEQGWHMIEVVGRDAESAFIPVDEGTVYFNNTQRARRSLYRLGPSGLVPTNIAQGVNGAISLPKFSVDFARAAFVTEALGRPPEVHIWQENLGAKPLTNLNAEISAKQLPKGREIVWKSKDGSIVQGWLLEPDTADKPWPLLTFVHGGPSLVMPDEFASYFKFWPYPFEAFATRGIAVFLPNYRGTRSFGFSHADPTRLDGEPVDDIVGGVRHLIRKGLADPERLGISGHSHGAWLATLVMTRSKQFRAGSFAEGIQNQIVLYNLMPGFLNRITHDVQYGVSLYDDPQRYLDLSPDLHLKGLKTAVLFEAGAKSAAIAMIGTPKAAARAGMPAEFIVYPQTGHNLELPRLQRESAMRNLDWFRFWLLDEEDPSVGKTEQYARWRKMRKEPSQEKIAAPPRNCEVQ